VLTKEGPAELQLPGPRPQGGPPVTQTVYRTDERWRMVRILQEAEERFRHELMGEEERLVLRERILRIKKRLAASA
jgi:hypothetical protein